MKQNFNFKKVFLITMIISLSISALIGIFLFLFGKFGEIEAKLLITTLTIGFYSLTGLCCSVLYERRKSIPLALSGIMISIIGFLFTILVIWGVINLKNSWKPMTIFIILTISFAHSSLLSLIKSEKRLVNTILLTTIIFIFIVALMLINLVLDEIRMRNGELYYRLLGVFAILDVLGTIIIPILNKVYAINPIKKET